MADWVLLDYGEVVCHPQPDRDVGALALLAGLEPVPFRDRYWRYRDDFDRGQAVHLYWSAVLGRALVPGDPLVARLTAVDVASWSHLDHDVLRALVGIRRRHRLALLSNAPEPLAAAIDRAPWAGIFTHRFYSCRFALSKPDPVLFEKVLRVLDAPPASVIFIDDREDNVRAADALGIRALRYRGRSVEAMIRDAELDGAAPGDSH